MKSGQLAFLAGTVLATLATINGNAQAQVPTVLNQNVPVEASAIPTGAFRLFICSQLGDCTPNDVQTIRLDQNVGCVPSSGSGLAFTCASPYVTNDTGFDFTRVTYRILDIPEQLNLVWNPASLHGFFNSAEILDHGKTLVFSDGLFPNGATVLAIRGTDIFPAVFTSVFEGTPAAAIPEPTTVLGFLAAGAIGGVLKKRVAKSRDEG
jgi:hypothetical protein